MLPEQQGPWPRRKGGNAAADPVVDNPIVSAEEALWYWTNPVYADRLGPGARPPREGRAGDPDARVRLRAGYDTDAGTGRRRPGFYRLDLNSIAVAFPASPEGNIKRPGSTPRPDFLTGVPGNYPYPTNLYFETPRTASAKLDFVREVGGYGVVVKDLAGDASDEGQSLVRKLKESTGPGVAPAREGLSTAAREVYERLAALEENARRGDHSAAKPQPKEWLGIASQNRLGLEIPHRFQRSSHEILFATFWLTRLWRVARL